jgi:2-polyprenyl-3-methyl-5-hydroxy-6-metoxy-1,4-benzoquinol methylase
MHYRVAMSDQAASADGVPPLAVQTEFWNEWNLSHLASTERDSFQLRQRGVAHAAAGRTAAGLKDGRPLRILDFGCGTGWLGASLTSFGDVTGIDLSPAAIEHGQQEFPDMHLIAGSFTDELLSGPFDLIISSDVIAHVSDQQAYIMRVADLLRPGGVFLLMTQNGFVWRRSSQLTPQGHGQIRNWPSLKALRTMLKGDGFQILRIGSIQPAGDRGILRVINSRSLRGVFKLIGLGAFWSTLLERLRVGRDLTIEARRR